MRRKIITISTTVLVLAFIHVSLWSQGNNNDAAYSLTKKVNQGGDFGTIDFGNLDPNIGIDLIIKTTRCDEVTGSVKKGEDSGWRGGGKGSSIMFSFAPAAVDSGKHPGKIGGELKGCGSGGPSQRTSTSTLSWSGKVEVCVEKDTPKPPQKEAKEFSGVLEYTPPGSPRFPGTTTPPNKVTQQVYYEGKLPVMCDGKNSDNKDAEIDYFNFRGIPDTIPIPLPTSAGDVASPGISNKVVADSEPEVNNCPCNNGSWRNIHVDVFAKAVYSLDSIFGEIPLPFKQERKLERYGEDEYDFTVNCCTNTDIK